MSRTMSIATLFVAALSCPSLAFAFEGVISFKSNYWGEASEFQYYSKDERNRIETQRARHGRAAVIMDFKTKKVSMLLLNLRLAMVMNMNFATLLASNDAAGKLTRMGESKLVLGYRAEQFLHDGEEEHTEIWGTTGLGLFVGLHPTSSMFGRTGGAPPWVRALREQGIFPLIVIRTDKDGKERGRMEATAIENKVLSDDLFEVPPRYITYNKFDPGNKMPGMPGTVWVK
jgi:Domain of unknown function (DUF4412)